jgi:alanine-synthesizing transaminase
MLSRRVPHDLEPTPWARLLAERKRSGEPILDLTEANPTHVGLGGAGEAELAALSDPAAARYDPDPRGSGAARRAVAGYYAARGLHVDPEHIVLTASTSEAYAHLFRLLTDPGEGFVAPAPGYPLFDPLAAAEGVSLGFYRLAHDGAWRLDRGSLERAFERGARGVIVVQPNHPTGSLLDAEEIGHIEALCERHGAAIVSDEVFGDYPLPPAAGTLPSLVSATRVPTFVLSGLSKVCGMPGMKLSWIVAAGPEGARVPSLAGLEWIADLFLSVSAPVQAALPRLLEARHAFQARVRARIAENLAALHAEIARTPALSWLPATGGWSAVLRVPRGRGEEDWALELLRRGVIVHPGHFYDFEGEAHLVLSLVVETADFAEGLRRIARLAAEG